MRNSIKLGIIFYTSAGILFAQEQDVVPQQELRVAAARKLTNIGIPNFFPPVLPQDLDLFFQDGVGGTDAPSIDDLGAIIALPRSEQWRLKLGGSAYHLAYRFLANGQSGFVAIAVTEDLGYAYFSPLRGVIFLNGILEGGSRELVEQKLKDLGVDHKIHKRLPSITFSANLFPEALRFIRTAQQELERIGKFKFAQFSAENYMFPFEFGIPHQIDPSAPTIQISQLRTVSRVFLEAGKKFKTSPQIRLPAASEQEGASSVGRGCKKILRFLGSILGRGNHRGW